MEEDSDEEWFLDSIKRYKQLIMFDTGDPILQIELVDKETICLLSERNSVKKAISILTLPTKITNTNLNLSEIQESSDMKIKTGTIPSFPPGRIMAVYGENKLLTTKHDANGLHLYDIKLSDSDQIIHSCTMNIPLANPYMALVNNTTVVLTKDTQQKSFIGDLKTGEILNELILDKTHSNVVIPVCLNENIIAFSEKVNGTAHLYDWKSSKLIGKVHGGDESDAAIFPASTYLCNQSSSSLSSLYFLSQTGVFKVYDMRDTTKPLIRHKLKLLTTNERLKVCFKPDNCNILSITGFDNSVHIYNISEGMAEIFIHDGHPRTEDCEKRTIVTDHLWYPNEFIISGALNKSINCWIPEGVYT